MAGWTTKWYLTKVEQKIIAIIILILILIVVLNQAIYFHLKMVLKISKTHVLVELTQVCLDLTEKFVSFN